MLTERASERQLGRAIAEALDQVAVRIEAQDAATRQAGDQHQ